MPFSTLRLRPGVNVELTLSQNEAGYSLTQLVRYRNGLAEKLGGWDKFYQFAVGGVPKALHAWQDINENKYLAVGSTTILASISGGALTDVTPQEYLSDFTPNFDTTISSPNVTVDDSNVSTITAFDSVEFNTPISVGGIILSGLYPVALNLGATTYRIIAAANATASVTNGGVVPQFGTTNGSATVLVTFPNHGLSVGGTINLPIETIVGGVSILGTYAALTVPTANTFTIAASTLATSTTSAFMNGGDAQIVYRIALGPVPSGTGYGIGTYGSGGYGTGAAPGQQTGTPITTTDWTLDNFGQTLLACPTGGGIYTWTPGTGLLNAQMIGTAPPKNTGMFMATEIEILVAYGSSAEQDIGVDPNPMLVRWSNQGEIYNFDLFAPAGTSQAGQKQLSTGSRIVGGLAGPLNNLLWTDVGLWIMSYIGPTDVFGFNPVAYGCGLIGQHAAVRLGSNVYWMNDTNFYVLSANGSPQVIPCTVWDAVFQDLNQSHKHKCWAWANSPFNEVWFFYPRESTGATEPDAYAIFHTDGLWYNGTMSRSAGINQSILGMPIAATPDGLIYEHEVSRNADGAAMNAYFETGYFQLAEGEQIMMMDWVLPDAKFGEAGGSQNASLQLSYDVVYYPGDTQRTYGPYTFNSTTRYINMRIRGRLASLRLESNDLDSFWRVGALRMRGQQDGRL